MSVLPRPSLFVLPPRKAAPKTSHAARLLIGGVCLPCKVDKMDKERCRIALHHPRRLPLGGYAALEIVETEKAFDGIVSNVRDHLVDIEFIVGAEKTDFVVLP